METTANFRNFEHEAKPNIQLSCTFETIKHQIQLFIQQVRVQRIHCKAKVPINPILHLRIDEELFVCFQRFLQAIVVFFSEYMFNISTV